MAYRGDHAGHVLEAPTLAGPLRVEMGATSIDLASGDERLNVSGKFVTLVVGDKPPQSFTGTLAIVRGVPREDLAIWIEVPEPGEPRGSMRRIFGVAPVSSLEPQGLASLAQLDAIVHRLRGALVTRAAWRGIEIGRGHALDKVVLLDRGDHHALYARRLFGDRAKLVMIIEAGRITLGGVQAFPLRSRYGITVRGDNLRFADAHGVDLAKVSIPWITPEDRDELAQRIGALVEKT